MSQAFNYHAKFRGNFINGEYRLPEDPNGEWKLKSPADLEDVIGVLAYEYSHVDLAVSSAREAFEPWRKLDLAQRAGYLKKYQDAIRRREKDFIEIISREMGKPHWEAKTEVAGLIGKVDVTINDSMKWVEDFEISEIQKGMRGACRYKPLGVSVVIGPFNFPAHLPNGHIVPSLLTGNTVVFKPSEKTPFTGLLMAECFEEAGFPPGVFNLVLGEKEFSRRLVVHEGVDAVLFTGSYEVGLRIKQDTLSQHWKLLALEMGGKNSAIVFPDVDLDQALLEVLTGAYITTGQRCSCTSRVFVHEKIFDEFLSKFHERAKSFQIGPPETNPFMGPLIDKTSVDRYTKFVGIAAREGLEVVMRGKSLDPGKSGHYVAPSVCASSKSLPVSAMKKSVFQQTEIFAPCVTLLPFQEVEEATAGANATHYGLVNSVFTRDPKMYQKAWSDLQSGLINWNKSTVGASGKLPFGGIKKSGNHWPTAVSATRYCTYPVASVEAENPSPAQPEKYPGLNW